MAAANRRTRSASRQAASYPQAACRTARQRPCGSWERIVLGWPRHTLGNRRSKDDDSSRGDGACQVPGPRFEGALGADPTPRALSAARMALPTEAKQQGRPIRLTAESSLVRLPLRPNLVIFPDLPMRTRWQQLQPSWFGSDAPPPLVHDAPAWFGGRWQHEKNSAPKEAADRPKRRPTAAAGGDCAVIGVGRPWLPVDRRQKGGARGCGGSWGDLEAWAGRGSRLPRLVTRDAGLGAVVPRGAAHRLRAGPPCRGTEQAVRRGHRVVSAPSLDHSALPPAGVGGSWGTVGGEWGPLPALHAPTQACCSGAGGHPAGRRQPESPPFSRRWPGVRWLTERGGDPRAPPERVVRGLGRRPQGVGDGYAPRPRRRLSEAPFHPNHDPVGDPQRTFARCYPGAKPTVGVAAPAGTSTAVGCSTHPRAAACADARPPARPPACPPVPNVGPLAPPSSSRAPRRICRHLWCAHRTRARPLHLSTHAPQCLGSLHLSLAALCEGVTAFPPTGLRRPPPPQGGV
ncbi:hypothetical protein BU14_0093s0050 [Porphyra umbilicalis]|uniref:Uncharacterized protein n=1 Tax=Porphyra umbilicalis TaxID=2786 RepID=A0A1X6PDQ1_PORUM|nr:hypothetical protein BU14_0093s0050 [Porphyra umbilicalis]|eukprot:OSX79007.1 hypothetical protein BU14_0093s0050 [Porphyra umbilicalis]